LNFSFAGNSSIVCFVGLLFLGWFVYIFWSFWLGYHILPFFLEYQLGWLCLFLGDTKVLAAVYGPKVGTKKNENPEKACIEVIWKPKTGQIGEFSIYFC
jgi:hypothetical protein